MSKKLHIEYKNGVQLLTENETFTVVNYKTSFVFRNIKNWSEALNKYNEQINLNTIIKYPKFETYTGYIN